MLPINSKIINNPKGSAVGFYLEFNGRLIICTQGYHLNCVYVGWIYSSNFANKFPSAQSKYIRRLKCFGYRVFFTATPDNCPDWPEEVHLDFAEFHY